MKGEEAQNKLNTTSSPAARRPELRPRWKAREVLTGHPDRVGVGGLPQDGVGPGSRLEASPGVSAVGGRRGAGGLGRANLDESEGTPDISSGGARAPGIGLNRSPAVHCMCLVRPPHQCTLDGNLFTLC